MKLILKSLVNNEYIESKSFQIFEPYQNILEELPNLKKPITADLIANREKINSRELVKLIINLEKLDIKLVNIYSDYRETILSGKSLKINSTLIDYKKHNHEKFLNPLKEQKDILHKGTVRSGNRISSNGDLFIVGDVNPGAIISAKNSIYVWGKLLGIAVAGEDGNKNASISSLYLNPLQIRLCEIIALGPKEKPTNKYPEVAVLEGELIIIKPYIIGK